MTRPVTSTRVPRNEAVWFALKAAGITIAYPQADLHLDEPALQALRARGD